jgi:Sulfocyanin (SoxE) domain
MSDTRSSFRSWTWLICRAVLVGAVLTASLGAQPTLAAHRFASQPKAPRWLVWNARTHSVSLTLIAGYTKALSGYNFNGYGNGKMVITVPVGAKLNVTFSNKSTTLAHGLLFTPYADRNSTSSLPVAFHGGSIPHATTGITAGKVVKFSFVAGKVGKYAIVCPVPGHEPAGMWDVLNVVRHGSATIKFL